jgi:hypothetical protein
MTDLLHNPLHLTVVIAVVLAGIVIFWQGQKRASVPLRLAGAIIGLAPLVIHEPDHLLGFVAGVGLGLWMYLRVT